jgi:hypothetical protein
MASGDDRARLAAARKLEGTLEDLDWSLKRTASRRFSRQPESWKLP